MSQSSKIQVGDEVSWKWGGGRPTGKVAEMKTSGKLEIESKGKRIHKNADADDPAVHIERDGNDVVKRASELTRLRGGGDEDAKDAQGGEGSGAVDGGKDKDVTTIQEGENVGATIAAQEAPPTQEGVGTAEEIQPAAEEPRKKSTRGRRGGKPATVEGKKGAAAKTKKATGRKRGKAQAEEAEVGQKRERGEAEKEGEDVDMEKGEKEKVLVTTEQEMAERKAGREAKKAKVAQEGTGEEQVVESGGPQVAKALHEPDIALGTEPSAAAQTTKEGAVAAEAGPAVEATRAGKRGGRRGKVQ